ncbi:MAG: transporter substrate-binding domain-containing protein [Enterobacteriaceae bacterium]
MKYRNLIQIPLALLTMIGFAITAHAQDAQSKPKEGTVLNVAVAANSPPMLFKSPDGKIEGADLEIFTDYCKVRGCKMNIKQYTFDGMLGAVASGQADVAFSAISITPKREQAMDFSKPYYKNTWYLTSMSNRDIDLSDLKNLKKYTVGYPRGMAYTDLINNKLAPEGYMTMKQVKLYPSYAEVITELENGNIDLAFLEEPVLKQYQNKRKIPLTPRRAFENMDTLGFAFTKGSKLRDDFNKYLDEVGQKKIDAITSKWMN